MYLPVADHTCLPHHDTVTPWTVDTLLEKGSGKDNEDILLEGEYTFGVFDGATSLDSRRFAGDLSGGLLAARIAARTFRETDTSLAGLAARANDRIRKAMEKEGISMNERHRLWSTSLAVVRFCQHGIEYCHTGDAVILLVKKNGGHHLLTPAMDIDRETLCLWQNVAKQTTAIISDLLADQIRRVRLQMNVSYGVLNGEPQALDFLGHGSVDLRGITDILLFTDGLFLPRENLSSNEDWQQMVDLYHLGGLEAIRNHVRRLHQLDPFCQTYPRFKQHDDIAAVSLQLHSDPQEKIALS